jgi:hypothetical protein
MQKRKAPHRRKLRPRKLPMPIGPLPVTDTIPKAGAFFYGASRGQSYRMARGENPAIPTVALGPKLKRALMHVLARRLGIDPLSGGQQLIENK